MKAISDRANKSYFTGPGRGSAAGSLVAYVLGITQVDPIKYKLQFERFLSSTATDYPDIDYDVSDAMGLKQNLIDEWGENRVVPITNWNTLQLRSLIKDIGKFYGVDFQEVNAVTSKMLFEATPQAKAEHGITAGVYTPTFDEVMKYSKTLQDFLDKYPNIKTHVNQLYGNIRSCFSDKVSILTDNGYKTIKEIGSEDRVAYYGNDNSIHYNGKYEIYFQGRKEVFEVELEDGTTLELTEDHRVLTQFGYKQVKDLEENDVLFSVE
jgi:hypothetical protein